MNLFGRKKQDISSSGSTSNGPTTNSTTAAIGKLRDHIELLEKREELLIRKIDNEIKQAKSFGNQNKKREALVCLKRKNMYQKQLDQIAATKMNLEMQRLQLENVNITQATLEVTKHGAKAMADATRRMGGVDAVENVIDEMEEGLQDAKEIDDAISRPINYGQEDDDELLAQLEELEQGDLNQQFTNDVTDDVTANTNANTNEEFPQAAQHTVAVSKNKQQLDEERELAELEASMAMN
eukprot:CAMPEP_0119309090 /NCGR_PEP_ID=MMETSP1333-20130426/14245_1 /TAXON_ID=418940 /ORGANISM="Scyphosphaera apsteinii, Strain RCC1455" /LENGTH=238 /DNA_ID=CAMNT_0007313007 /DNA_START=13 /DNA_END=729 /DNA_ORIENTATION=+